MTTTTHPALSGFAAPTRAWFSGAFREPTPAQAGAWEAIGSGRHTLVVAPTGSGKTLAAFLAALDSLAFGPPPQAGRCRVVYVSPLKALAVDVERNLRAPLAGLRVAAGRSGHPMAEVEVATRTGDTPAAERRRFATAGADILITTPESLFLLLTSQAREALAGVQTVILDEVHALAGTKRGAHLAVSLERLDALLPEPATRIGLSATVRPVEEVARFLAGGRPVEVVDPPTSKEWGLRVVVPVPDLEELPDRAEAAADLTGPATAAAQPAHASIWPHVEERVVDLIAEHRSTLVFTNSRRLAERLTNNLNEVWAQRHTDPECQGAPEADVLARAHHGSVSKQVRSEIEGELKAGRLPAVVATSSLELGIDMGAVDLVVQVEAPPSVASGLQRVGRAGHQVGALSQGVFFPKFRGDLLGCAVVVERMLAGQIEATSVPANPLDVLAQQVVAACALDDWPVDDLFDLVRRSAPFTALTRPVFDAVLDMLSGRYPSEEFAQLRPRVVWDRAEQVLRGRPGAQRLAVTSGGTIPDRGLYTVVLADADGPGRRVGELDEEMVYESRVGDVFTLGTSTWRIEEITPDRVLVSPAPGLPGKLPFWKGDALGRPAELGAALGAFVREVGGADDGAARGRLTAAGLDRWAADNLLAYLREQREATGVLPDDRTVVIERFRDELGDWRVVVHSPFGGRVHAPWALAVAARLRERFGVEVSAMSGDDGIVVRLPDVEFEDDAQLSAAIGEAVLVPAQEARSLVTDEIGGSALFAARFRECASRALLLPRRNPGRRQALWQQRQRAAQLLEVAARYPAFPMVLETVRECLQDVYDLPALGDLLGRIERRQVRVVEALTKRPSPFARSLLFGYVAQYLYEGDSPLAERRAAALTLDPELLADLLGADATALSDLLDPKAVDALEATLQRLDPQVAARDAEGVADVVRLLGPVTTHEVQARVRPTERGLVEGWLADLAAARRLIEVRVAGRACWAAVEDAARLRDAVGVALPPGLPDALLEPVADPLGDLAARYARTHGPFGVEGFAAWLGLGRAVAAPALRRMVAVGRLVEGDLRPARPADAAGPDLCDAEVLRRLRRASLAALRREIEPVPTRDLARFLPAWQGVGARAHGVDAVLRAIEQLAGAVVPASALETLILPARVSDYAPHQLDELLASGEVIWQGAGALPGDDGYLALHVADSAHLSLLEAAPEPPGPLPAAILAALAGGGAFLFRQLADAVAAALAPSGGSATDTQVVEALWELVWAGRVGNDTAAALRARVARRPAHRPSRQARPGRARVLGRSRPSGAVRSSPPAAAGRWFLMPEPEADPTTRALARAEILLERYGVLTRGAVAAEEVPGGFAGVAAVLRAAEEAGRVRRGYFVEHCGASQFAGTGAVDRLRAADGGGRALVLAAADPANPFGAALPWPERSTAQARPGHRPGRKAGALVVVVDGALAFYVERGGRTLLCFTGDEGALREGADALAQAVRSGALGSLTVQRADGDALLGSDHPVGVALTQAGFHLTPRGLRMRR